MQERRDNKWRVLCLAAALAAALSGCGGTAHPTITPTLTPSPPPTDTPEPTVTLSPTATPAPTDVPATDVPTSAPTPTPTDTPTATLIPTPEETPTPAVELTPIKAITADRAGEEVTVEGAVVGTASFSAGFKFTLDDGTGLIVLLMWHNVYDDCWDAAEINLDAEVRATGQVAEYEGELQIQPDFGGDVKAVEGATAGAAPREIGTLTGDDEGQRVMVEGQVVRVEGLGDAVKSFVRDDTGEIVVFMWRAVLDRVANSAGLGTPGSLVRIVGTVQVYRGNLEIVPTLPVDVTVLEMP
jgi:uncharacterized protein YdeI (BOF family)